MGAHQSDSLRDLITSVSEISYDEVSKVCYPLFKKTPINYFDYTRYYDTGEMVAFGTSPDFTTKYYNQNLYPSLEEFKQYNAFGLTATFLSDCMPLPAGAGNINPTRYEENISYASEFNIFHRLYIVERHADYYLTCGFGVGGKVKSIFNFYLNAMSNLKGFVRYFERQIQDTITSHCQKKPIIMPYYLTKGSEEPCLSAPEMNLSELDFSISPVGITPREIECLELISRGYTMKNAARKLEISHRTVEQHLRNIKDKYQLNTKNQLVELWHNQFGLQAFNKHR